MSYLNIVLAALVDDLDLWLESLGMYSIHMEMSEPDWNYINSGF